MENRSVLHFSWEGDPSGKEEWQLGVHANGQEIATSSYTEGWAVDIPLTDTNLELKVILDTGNGRQVTHFKRAFQLNPGSNYTCVVDGSAKNSSGLGVRFCEGDEMEEGTSKLSGNKFNVVFMSLLFPVYGIYKAITDSYMRVSAIAGAAIGFLLGMILSAMTEDGDTVVLGFKSIKLLEYEPFSFLDIVINLLIGGIASINGLLRLFLESLLS